MISHYSLVQYAPDPIRGERINIGVVVYDGQGAAKTLFVENWSRVKQFSGHDVSFLREVAHEAKRWDAATVERLSAQWTGTLQITPSLPSTLPVDQLLIDASGRYLVEPTATVNRGYRVKSTAVAIARKRVREKLTERFGAQGRAYLKDEDYAIQGSHKQYTLDVTVANDELLYGAEALSFEVPDWRRVDRDVNAAAWLVRDVKDAHPDFDIGVMVLPPRDSSDMERQEKYGLAVRLIGNNGAKVLPESGFSAWAETMALTRVPARQ